MNGDLKKIPKKLNHKNKKILEELHSVTDECEGQFPRSYKLTKEMKPHGRGEKEENVVLPKVETSHTGECRRNPKKTKSKNSKSKSTTFMTNFEAKKIFFENNITKGVNMVNCTGDFAGIMSFCAQDRSRTNKSALL